MQELQLFTHGDNIPVHRQSNKDRRKIAEGIVALVEEGELDPLEALQSLKAWEKIFKAINDDPKFRKIVLEAAEPYEKSFAIGGNKLEKAEAGVEYDFSKCNDPEYDAILGQFNYVKAALDKRKEFLKKLSPKGMTVVDEDTGETYTIYPPARTSTSIVKVTLK